MARLLAIVLGVGLPAAATAGEPPDLRVSASLGSRSESSDFASDGESELADYVVDGGAICIGLDAERELVRGDLLAIQVDARYQLARSGAGLSGDAVEGVAFTRHEMGAGVRVGSTAPLGFVAPSVRAGYHYELLRVSDLGNAARLPSESLSGFTVGLWADAPDLVDRWSARAGVDLMLGGARGQSEGLEDGQISSASARFAHLAVSFAVTSRLSATAAYRYGHAVTTWSGASSRQPDVTDARRIDGRHDLSLGLARTF